jgi:serine/threonine-protein kinase
VSDPVHPDSIQARVQRAIGSGYELVQVIGSGGMGQVWLAREAALRRLVAIKVLHPALGASEVARRRFRRECEMAAQLDHPGVVPVHRIGESGDIAWFAMAFVDGETLADRLAREGRLPMAAALHLAREVADALAAAHRHGIVHRDVKPQNILLERESGRAMVSDFGIARALHPTPTEGADSLSLTGTGSVLGTPRYMSPEQALGRRDVGPPSDLYSLGIILYEAIAGAYPYDEIPEGRAATVHLTGEVVWLAAREPGVPGPVDALVRRLLDKDPAERPTASAVVAVLDELGMGGSGPYPAARGPAAAATVRRRVVLAGVAAVLVLTAGLVLFSFLRRGEGAMAARNPLPPGRVRVVVAVEESGTGRSLWADTLDAHPDSVAAALEVLRRRVPAGLGP